MKEQINNPFPAEIQASQKEYNKNIDSLVKEYGGSFFRRLLGAGLITKEEIVKMDAEIENETIDRSNASPNDENIKEYLNKLRNSNVILNSYVNEPNSILNYPKPYSEIRDRIDGTVDGKEILVIKSEITKGDARYFGTLDNTELKSEEAKKLFDDYYDIAKDRTGKIKQIVKENDLKMGKEVTGETFFTERDLKNADQAYVLAANELNGIDLSSAEDSILDKVLKNYIKASTEYKKIHRFLHPEMYSGGNEKVTILPSVELSAWAKNLSTFGGLVE